MTPKRIESGQDLLFRMAQENPGGNDRHSGWQARLAAGIWVKNELVALGWNQAKSHPLQKRFPKAPGYVYLHAEIHAITMALKKMNPEELMAARTTLIVVRAKRESGKRNASWVRGLAKPCVGCQAAILHFQMKEVIWSEDGGGHAHVDCDCE